MNDSLWLAFYQIARHLLTSMPPPDKIEGQERAQILEMRAALVTLIRTTELRFDLPKTLLSRQERNQGKRRIPI